MCLLNDFFAEHRDKYNIFLVYITEAHAADVWNIGMAAGAINKKHVTLEDRIKCAQGLIDEFSLTLQVLCDNMNDEFETIFASWPTRYFVVVGGKIVMISEPQNSEIDIMELFGFLDTI